MSIFNKTKKISFIFLGIFILSFLVGVKVSSAEGTDCTIQSATFSPTGEQADDWYTDANPPKVKVEASGINCAGKNVSLNIVYDGVIDKDVEGIFDTQLTFGSDNKTSVIFEISENQCFGLIGIIDCNYYIEIKSSNGNKFSSKEDIGSHLKYNCDGQCNSGQIWKIYTIPKPTQQEVRNPTETKYTLLAPFGDFKDIDTLEDPKTNPCPLGKYLNTMIKIFLGICAVLAMVMIVMGGIEYMTTELISSKEEGKSRITNALLGLLIALGSYLILNTINPDLLKACLTLPPIEVSSAQTGGQASVVLGDDAYKNAISAEDKTGVPASFILAIFGQESSSGRDTGSCTWKQEHVMREEEGERKDQTAFLEIINELKTYDKFTLKDKDINEIRVSCPSKDGWGGAMGLTQVLPSTWNDYENNAKTILGHWPDPWNLTDSILVSSLYLKFLGGADGNDYNFLMNVACKYYAGPTHPCSDYNGKNAFYGIGVMTRKLDFDKQIEELKKKGEHPT